MNQAIPRELIIWAIFFIVVSLFFQFLHECGHGFGSQIDGVHVSTGFNRVGDVGKRPSDQDFRSEQIITWTLNSGGLLGPFVNWMFAIVFTILLMFYSKTNLKAFFIGGIAIINALMRFLPMTIFFIGASKGELWLEDEVSCGLRAIEGINFPMPLLDFKILSKSQSALFLSEPKLYFWPILSFIISLVCLVSTYWKLNKLFNEIICSRLYRWFFWFLPFILWPLIYIIGSFLDNMIRINW